MARRRTLGTLARPGWSTSRICGGEGVGGRVHGQYRRHYYRLGRRTRDVATSPETSASRKRGRSARRREMFSSGIPALTNWRRARRRFVMNLRVRRVQEVFDMVATRPTRRRASCRTCRTKGLAGCVIASEKYPEFRRAKREMRILHLSRLRPIRIRPLKFRGSIDQSAPPPRTADFQYQKEGRGRALHHARCLGTRGVPPVETTRRACSAHSAVFEATCPRLRSRA